MEHGGIVLQPYAARHDGTHWIVEVDGSGEFYEMPPACIDALEHLEQGKPIDEIQSILQDKYPAELIDMADFLGQLREIGLIRTDGENETAAGQLQENGYLKRSRTADAFAFLLFNRYSAPIYAVLFAVNIILFLSGKGLFPRYRDPIVFDSMLLNSLLWLTVSFLLVMNHESGHFLAARARGIGAKLGIGHRLFLIVLETDMTRVWRLPASQRFLPYLGGICMDQALLFILLILRLVFTDVYPLSGVLALAVYYLVLTTAYQFMFFLKTDLYYVCENVTGCYNLMEDSKAWLAGLLKTAGAPGTAGFSEKERTIIRRYAFFYASGTLFSLALFILYIAPQIGYACSRALQHILRPEQGWQLLDGLTFLIEVALYATFLIYSTYKNRAAAAAAVKS